MVDSALARSFPAWVTLPAAWLAAACSTLVAIDCSDDVSIRPADWARAMSLTSEESAVETLGKVVVVVECLFGSWPPPHVSHRPRPIPKSATATRLEDIARAR